MRGRIIVGLDPGSVIMGFAIIEEAEIGNATKLIEYGVLQLKKYKGHMLRMRHIYLHMMTLFQKHAPDEVAIESIFYGTNVQSMLKLGRAQGVAIAAALACEIPVTEYAPRKVKQAVTGNGNALKEQVATMVRQLLNIPTPSNFLDASDALAVALCHSQQRLSSTAKPKSWSQFIATHPKREISTY
ncbi:MAG: crossover junction endodeoxyribonuclease RuvC [Candidatus Cardinium sp.]|uniref:crossover junction endodeoxyribonuclease RuvC n=1 Tax=Cardinium endosymbiont of Dermatophagoides farinae TaxID=2597823 RepID=UPI0011841398|nr:crossover junction endodeoxyribonuclease RuvC [Cardinium endosymbiont of Dermatophagoides farinae]TSJ81406.1 crossover junction endodeoxyribonuclease RuvC [Cardinium endosymbiont of Dermatophagoides farinae]UWW97468.1 MAG: crossover junction endodeoxyribonuclease RuvC [Candidatus Cardinium sp.]